MTSTSAWPHPVLSVLGTVRHVGPLGSGARLKLVANSMLADVVLAAAELQVAGERAGLQPDDVSWVLERMAPLLAARRNGIVENHHEPTLFALRDLRKDLDLAVGLFGRSKVDAPPRRRRGEQVWRPGHHRGRATLSGARARPGKLITVALPVTEQAGAVT